MSENTTDNGSSQAEGYDASKDPDSDPEMLQTGSTAEEGENTRDPAEGAPDESATDG